MGELEASLSLGTFAGLFIPDSDSSDSSLLLRFPKLIVVLVPEEIEPDAGGLRSDPFRTNPSEESKESQVQFKTPALAV